MPYALDNDAWGCFLKSLPFNETAWLRMLDKVPASQPPLWALVPDVVADKDKTLDAWAKHLPSVAGRGWPLAFAVQNGMSPIDVPIEADVVFIGGTTEWKWSTVKLWVDNFPRVHIGRVNGARRLWIAQRIGAESCDGSGYFRATTNGLEARKLKAWLHHETDPQRELIPA